LRLQTAITIGEYPDSTEAPSQPLVRRISSLGKRTQIYVGVSSAWIDWRAGAQIRAFGHFRLQTSPRMSAVGGKADVARRWSAFPLIAISGSSLSCNQTLAAIQTRSFETVQERLGILKAQSVNALGVLVRAKARIGLKNLAYNMRRLVQLERHAMAGAS